MRLFNSLLLVSFATGCDDPRPTVITLETEEPPALVAFRDEASTEWQNLAIAGNTFTIDATGPYRLVVVCEVLGSLADVTQYARTLDDDPLIEHACDSVADPFTVRGTMVQPGELNLGFAWAGGQEPNWSFQLPAAAGSSDLVMLAEDGRIAIRRDLEISGDRQLGAIDLAREGLQAKVPTSFTAANLRPGETLRSSLYLQTGGTFTFLHFGPDWNIDLVPQGILRASDHQSAGFTAAEDATSTSPLRRTRFVRRDVRAGEPATIALPEPLGAIAFEATPDRLVASWSELPAYDLLMVARDSFNADITQMWLHSLVLTRSFVEAIGLTSAALDLHDVPGFKAEWRLDPALAQQRRFIARRGLSRYDLASSTVTEQLDAAAPLRAPAPGAMRRRALRGEM